MKGRKGETNQTELVTDCLTYFWYILAQKHINLTIEENTINLQKLNFEASL